MTENIPKLGHHFEICVDVDDMVKTIEFYKSIGFKIFSGGDGEWCTMTDGIVYFAFFPDGFIQKEFGVKVLFNYRGGNVNKTANFIKGKNVEFSKFAPKNDGTGDAIFSDLNGYKFYLDTALKEDRIDVPDS